MPRKISVFGYNVSIEKAKKNTSTDIDLAIEGAKILKEYFAGKEQLDQRIIENHKWWKGRHWDLFRSQLRKNDPEPVTMYLFNMIANKHADAMDNYPSFNVLPRKEADKKEAEMLSKIIPAIYDSNRFRRTYANGWWYKLLNGCVPYGQFWDAEKLEGMGDIVVTRLDLLNLAWQPGVKDIQDGSNFFIIGLEDDEVLADTYANILDDTTIIKGKRIIDPKQYAYDDHIDITKKSVVVDWYMRRRGNDGRIQLHLVKFVGSTVLYNSMEDEQYKDRGIYDHGEYPVDFDVLFPEEGYPTGFGLVDLAKNPQMYIDKLDQIISKNALIAGKMRWFIKRGGSVSKDDIVDFSKDIIEVDGPLNEEYIRMFQAKPLDPFIAQHRQNKIQEMKEITANDVFASGEGGKGVTAARAIYALQEAGNKLSRDMIGMTYENLTSMVYKTIELVRQFYDKERDFRITGQNGQYQYVTYTNAGIVPQPLPPAYPNEGMIFDLDTQTFIQDKNYRPKYRKPVFDVTIVPEKKSPFSTVLYNEMAKEMFQIGMFAPQRAPEAKIALEMMNFEGKETILQKIAENGDLLQQFQQQTTAMQQEMAKMWEIIRLLGGEELLKQQGGPAV
ncbi:hypothetical protein BR63_11240 [Thermanaerosceptrum fracticalcis]|jgi:hypothetical protein|uniref:Uncharacterized protein n=1 Tax=Thermanaerosceptrum fracticalcis TaxID=1712410 RepID=A0A7G6E429_THEFR|nr:hypothetical protein [Thermanaerosceptrum fracticalcis]QNB46833.1 hypothetical protein BR63_11240 [Thermanaerosceptrum fracticalcis]